MIKRALVTGLGSIGTRHLRLLRECLPQADIRVLRHSGCTDKISDADGCFTDLRDACAFAPQAAVIANPAPFHLTAARALAEAGAHLLIEKPIADRLDGVADLLAVCATHGRVLQIGYNLRMLETLQHFRAELLAGRIGAVQVVRCEIGQYLPDWRPGTDYRSGVSAKRGLGGGVLLELSHELDMLRWVFGEFAWVGAWIGQQGTLDIDVEDCAHLSLGFAAGPVGQLGIDFLRRDTTRVCTAIAEAGSLRWDAVAGQVALYDPAAGGWKVLCAQRPDRDATYRAQLCRFLEAIELGVVQSGVATGDDGLAVVQIIEAARRSAAADGRRIYISDERAI